MHVIMKVFRFNPETDRKPRYDIFTVQADPSERILDLLERIRDDYDPTLAFRRSCAHGVCGSDSMRINGRNYLACKVLLQDLGVDAVTIEPMKGLPVLKDLIVDMEPFFDHYREVMPYLINEEVPADGKERLQSPEARERFDDTTKCILCGACTTSCPVFWSNGKYQGPAAIVNAHRFIFDSRDTAAEPRLAVLARQTGVWSCRTAFNCTEACPRDIKITQAIAEVKQAILTGKLES
jgi:succinate dehydrogenase / fumarate reductase iron-sulfur subunit